MNESLVFHFHLTARKTCQGKFARVGKAIKFILFDKNVLLFLGSGSHFFVYLRITKIYTSFDT